MNGMLLVIALAVTIGLSGLAKRGRGKRKFTRYLRGNIDLTFSLGALAGADVITQAVQDAVEEKAWLSSIKATYTMKDLTITADAGPLHMGVCHSDYSDAEVEEWIELTTGWAEGNLQSREVANRKIRRIGSFEASGQALATQVLNDGRPINTKCGWSLTTGQNVRFWVYNSGSAALATTTPDVSIQGHANLWPR